MIYAFTCLIKLSWHYSRLIVIPLNRTIALEVKLSKSCRLRMLDMVEQQVREVCEGFV